MVVVAVRSSPVRPGEKRGGRGVWREKEGREKEKIGRKKGRIDYLPSR